MATKIAINGGTVSCVYDDRFRPLLEALGVMHVERASNVEFNPDTRNWEATLTGDSAPIASDPNRDQVIKEEVAWIEENVICPTR